MGLALGVDLGGTKISCVLMDEKAHVITKIVRPTEAHKGRNSVIKNIASAMNELKIGEVKYAGIGVPGIIDLHGKIIFMPNIPCLKGCWLAKELEKKTGLWVTMENDAKCFALAESKIGAAKGLKDMLGIVIGTGVGCGIIADGNLYRGAGGGAGEAGHIKMLVGTQPVELESIISGKAMLERYYKATGRNAGKIHEIPKDDPAFKGIYSDFVLHTGIFLANMINIFNPQMIVIGGGVSNLDFYKDVRKMAKKHAVPYSAKECRIVKNKLGDDAGVLGAALLAL